MIYIFEDKTDDLISLLFKAGYNEKTASKFIYTNGNGALIGESKKQLQNTPNNEKICVFIDMAPGNKELYGIYRGLIKIAEQYTGRMIIMPLICAEYYLIRSFVNKPVLKSYVGVDICVNKEVYFNSPLIVTQQDKEFCKNFEKYCKLILIKNLMDCARHSRGIRHENLIYGAYYTKDCKCDAGTDSCVTEPVLKKSYDFLKNYPCIPEGSYFQDTQKYSDLEMQGIHRRLVDEFNEVIQKFIEADSVNKNRYKKIPYMM